LIDFAKAHFALDRITNGRTVREHLRQIEKTRGVILPELHPEPPASEVMHIWEWFIEISQARTANVSLGGVTVNTISFSEIKAWSELMAVTVSPWEIALLRQLDNEFVQWMNSKHG
jgi:predicted flavoprotein YhiN